MSMLLQHIRRSTYSRKGTGAALTPSPNTFSRFFSTTNRAVGPEKEETFAEILRTTVLKYGLGCSFIYGTFYWVDYGGYRKTKLEMKEVEDDIDREWKAFDKAVKQLDELREREREMWRMKEVESEV